MPMRMTGAILQELVTDQMGFLSTYLQEVFGKQNKDGLFFLLFKKIFNLVVVFIFNIAFVMVNTDFQLGMI